MAARHLAGSNLMADQSDVENALVAVLTNALYPNGASGTATLGVTTRIYRGWPTASALDADLSAGTVNVTVYSVEGSARNTTRWPYAWRATPAAPTLTTSVSGQSATFAGAAGAGQLAGLLVDNKTYVHRTANGDTPALVAALLGAAVGADLPVVVNGATVTVPDAWRLVARSAADAQASLEVRRQDQGFRITCWCPTPALRDATAAAVDLALSVSRFIALADGNTGWIRWSGTSSQDKSQNANLYRRDLTYSVDYPTNQLQAQPSMLFGDLVLGATSVNV
jgi:hypothetical protein